MVSRKIKKHNRNKKKYRRSVKLGRKQKGGALAPLVFNKKGEIIVYQGIFIKTPVSKKGPFGGNKQTRLIKLFEDRVEWWELKGKEPNGALFFEVRKPQINYDDGKTLTFINKEDAEKRLILENTNGMPEGELDKLKEITDEMKDITSPLFSSLISNKEVTLTQDEIFKRTNDFLNALDETGALDRYNYIAAAMVGVPDEVFKMMNEIITIINKIFYCEPTQGDADILIKKRNLIIKMLNKSVYAIQYFIIPMNKFTMDNNGVKIGLPMIDTRNNKTFMEHVKRILDDLDDSIMLANGTSPKPSLDKVLDSKYKEHLLKISNLDDAVKYKVPWSQLDPRLKQSYTEFLTTKSFTPIIYDSGKGPDNDYEGSWESYLELYHGTSFPALNSRVKQRYVNFFVESGLAPVPATSQAKIAWDADLNEAKVEAAAKEKEALAAAEEERKRAKKAAAIKAMDEAKAAADAKKEKERAEEERKEEEGMKAIEEAVAMAKAKKEQERAEKEQKRAEKAAAAIKAMDEAKAKAVAKEKEEQAEKEQKEKKGMEAIEEAVAMAKAKKEQKQAEMEAMEGAREAEREVAREAAATAGKEEEEGLQSERLGGKRKSHKKRRTRKHRKPKSHKKRKSGSRRKHRKTRR